MTVVFPNSNLPTSSQPWAREIQKQLSNIISSNTSSQINNAARDNQLNSSIIALNGVVNGLSAVQTDITNALVEIGLIEGQVTDIEDTVLVDGEPDKINGANIKVGTLSASSITTGTLNGNNVNITNLNANNITSGTISANTINGGAITASSLDLTSSSYAVKVGTSSSFAYFRVNPGGVNGVALNAVGFISPSVSGVISNWYPYNDDDVACGTTNFRWTRLWAVNGTVSTSDLRDKTNIETASLGLEFINKLRPVSYNMKIGGNSFVRDEDGEIAFDENGKPITESRPGVRRHWGLIAQEVKSALEEVNAPDFGGFIIDDLEDPNSHLSLSYEQFISPMIKAIQELSARVETLEKGA